MPLTYEQIKARKASDPEYAARLKSYADKYKEKNLDKEKERQRVGKAVKRSESREAYNAYMREWSRKNKEAISIRLKTRLLTDTDYAERVRLQARDRYTKNPDGKRSNRLKCTYGITLEDYRKMYLAQEGKCAICGSHCPDHGKNGLMVDHCHASGDVRKLLCTHCNKGIGQFKEDVLILTKAIEYLKLF